MSIELDTFFLKSAIEGVLAAQAIESFKSQERELRHLLKEEKWRREWEEQRRIQEAEEKRAQALEAKKRAARERKEAKKRSAEQEEIRAKQAFYAEVVTIRANKRFKGDRIFHPYLGVIALNEDRTISLARGYARELLNLKPRMWEPASDNA